MRAPLNLALELLMDNYKILIYYIIASLVPAATSFILNAACIYNSALDLLLIILWPGSFLLMSLANPDTTLSTVILVYSISISSNILIYCLIGYYLHKKVDVNRY